jgi:predicted DCC family thiol-disulfide oxidoreductase YuxK
MDTPPPSTPLLVYDGDCGFCRRWIARAQAMVGTAVDFAPYQEAASRYPSIPLDTFKSSVQLIEPDGTVRDGAHAAFRALYLARRSRWLLWCYLNLPAFAAAAEGIYRFVARHRGGLAGLDRWLVGPEPQLPSNFIARGLFLRLLGCVYLIAFLSCWAQVDGLIGSHGVLPIADYLNFLRDRLPNNRFLIVPTLCWFNASDGFLHFLCAAGSVLSILLILGLVLTLNCLLLWILYLSLTVAGQEFFSFQWDALLLEAGFLAIFVSPFQWRLSLARPSKPPTIGIWLLRWLVFRVMFLSGVLKWTAGDVIWQGLAAMRYHYETQPIPTWTSWYAHWLPDWFQAFSALGVFVVEAFIPLLYLMPRRLRAIGFWSTVVFQCLIMATGNYGFFNLLTIVLCVPLLDDQHWLFRRRAWPRVRDAVGTRAALRRRWPPFVTVPIGLALFLVTYTTVVEAVRPATTWSPGIITVSSYAQQLRFTSSYGLFRVMTQTRHEIILEGSDDRVNWQPYEFKWKPGNPTRAPSFCIPHMPRLDWQIWFAALADGQARWLYELTVRLLQGSPPVLQLLDHNPFPARPPRYVRAVMYDYHFADPASHRATGAWWRRTNLGVIFTLEQRPGVTGIMVVPN